VAERLSHSFVNIAVGIAVGAVASFVDIGTTWMTDLKYGICSEAFWFDREQCCWSSNQTTLIDNCSQVLFPTFPFDIDIDCPSTLNSEIEMNPLFVLDNRL